jgi:hypothetical protein
MSSQIISQHLEITLMRTYHTINVDLQVARQKREIPEVIELLETERNLCLASMDADTRLELQQLELPPMTASFCGRDGAEMVDTLETACNTTAAGDVVRVFRIVECPRCHSREMEGVRVCS